MDTIIASASKNGAAVDFDPTFGDFFLVVGFDSIAAGFDFKIAIDDIDGIAAANAFVFGVDLVVARDNFKVIFADDAIFEVAVDDERAGTLKDEVVMREESAANIFVPTGIN